MLTPFFLGAVAGAIASGRVPPGLATGDLLTSWLNPRSVFGGVLAVGTCAYLAAIYLCFDAERLGLPDLAEAFRRRGIGAGVVVGALALAGIAIPLVLISALAGLVSLGLLAARRYVLVRITAALSVTAVLWGWAVGQYPLMLPPTTTYISAAASESVLTAVAVVVAIGALLLVPSLTWLFVLFQRREADREPGFHDHVR